MAYIKGSIKKGSDVVYPTTALDKIVAVTGKSSSSAGTTIVDGSGATVTIKKAHLPSDTVYATSSPGEQIDKTLLPTDTVYATPYATISTELLPSGTNGVVYKVDGKIPKSLIPAAVDDIIQLVAFQSSAPTGTFNAGDQYYNSTSKKIFTYSGSAWDTTGATPTRDVIYYVPSLKTTYRWSAAATNPAMVEIAAALAVTKQGSATGSQLTDTDDFVPSDKAVKAHVAAAIVAGVPIANGSTAGLVYVAGGTSSAKGVQLTLNTTTGALSVTGVAAGNTAATAGVVYVNGGSSASNGITLTLSSGALSISASTATASGEYGVVTLEDDFSSYASSAWNTDIAVTPRAVKAWTDYILTGDGIAVNNNIASVKLAASNSGLTFDNKGLKIGTLTGTMVASGLSAGTGITSISGGTITAELSFQADT